MAKIQRCCIWCGVIYTSERQKAIFLCGSAACYKGFHRFRQKAAPGEGPAYGFELIQQLTTEQQHPNRNYKYQEVTPDESTSQ